MPVSCLLYELNASVNLRSLQSKASSGYSNTRSHGASGLTLKTDIADVQSTSFGFECKIQYDHAETRGHRTNMSKYYKEVITTPIRVSDKYFIIFGTKHTGREVSEVKELLNLSEGDYTKFNITEGIINRVVGVDSQREMQGAWDGIDNDTETGIIYGDIDQSSYASDFHTDGDVTYVKYESQNYPGSVGLSANRDSIVFWTNSWDRDDMEEYINNLVIN